MTLLAQTLGVLAVSCLVLALVRPGGGLTLTYAGVVLVVITVCAWVFFQNVYGAGRLAVGMYEHFGSFSSVDHKAAGGVIFPNNNEAFLGWVEAQVPVNARVYLDCGRPSACGNSLNEWITFRLGPRRFTERPQEADWVLFFGSDPAEASYAHGYQRLRFAERFEIARPAA